MGERTLPSRGLSLPTPSKSKTCPGVRRDSETGLCRHCASDTAERACLDSATAMRPLADCRIAKQASRNRRRHRASQSNRATIREDACVAGYQCRSCCILDYHTHMHQSAASHTWTNFFFEKESSLPDRSENKAARPRPFLHPPPCPVACRGACRTFAPPPSPPHPHHLGHGTHVNQALNPERTCRVPSRPTV